MAEAQAGQVSKRKERTGVYYTHVALECLSARGIGGVAAMHAASPISKDTVRAAIRFLAEDQGQADAAEALAGWYRDAFNVAAPGFQVGESREILAQQGKRGGAYLRIPSASEKGTRFSVKRTEKGFVVEVA